MPRSIDQLLASASQLPPIWDKNAWANPQLDNPWPEVIESMIIDASDIKPGFSDLSEIANDFLGGLNNRNAFVDEVSQRYQMGDLRCEVLYKLWEKYKPFCDYID